MYTYRSVYMLCKLILIHFISLQAQMCQYAYNYMTILSKKSDGASDQMNFSKPNELLACEIAQIYQIVFQHL